ncbi:unnamed protein product [Calypogeia fissa]
MVLAVRRGVMLLISASTATCGSAVVPSSASLSASHLCRRSPWEQQRHHGHAVWSAAMRNVSSSAIQQSSRWPMFGMNKLVVVSRRSFHALPSVATYGERFQGLDFGFQEESVRSAMKRLLWKRTLVFGFSDPPSWRQRSQRLHIDRLGSVGYGNDNVLGAEREGRTVFSRALSNSGEAAAAAAAATERAADVPQSFKDLGEGANGDQEELFPVERGRREILSRSLSNSAGAAGASSAAGRVGDVPKSLKEIREGESRDLEELFPLETGGREVFSRALSKSASEAAAARRAGDLPKAFKDLGEKENGVQEELFPQERGREMFSRPSLKSTLDAASASTRRARQGLRTFKNNTMKVDDRDLDRLFQLGENSGSSKIDEEPSGLPSKPGGTYFDKSASSRADGANGRSSAFERKWSDLEKRAQLKRAQINGGMSGRSPESVGSPPFRPKAKSYDRFSQPRRREGESGIFQANGEQGSVKPKSNSEKFGTPSFIRLKAWYQKNMIEPALAEAASKAAAAEGTSESPVKASSDLNVEISQPRNDAKGDGPNYRSSIRDSGAEASQFRWERNPQSRASGGGDGSGKRLPLQESGVLGRQAVPDSSSGRNSLNSKQTSPEEEDADDPHHGYKLKEGGAEMG